MNQYDGILPVFKDKGLTSHDVIYNLRKIIKMQKIGHTGTLDPMAQGLLLICLGRATKLTQFLSDWDKSYLAELTLGKTSNTFDAEGELTEIGPVPDLCKDDINNILKQFTGLITQTVPAYSAVKVNGKELYKYARKGIKIKSPQKDVFINSIELTKINLPVIGIRIDCGKGTYIRTLADDIGQVVGCGAYLSSLERQQVGPVNEDLALTLDTIQNLHNSGNLNNSVIPMERIIDFPLVSIRDDIAQNIKNGCIPSRKDIVRWKGNFLSGDLISMANEKGDILAIGKSICSDSELKNGSSNDFFTFVRVLV